MDNKFYTVIVIRLKHEKKLLFGGEEKGWNLEWRHSSRPKARYQNKEDAFHLVKTFSADISDDGYHEYCVIEEWGFGHVYAVGVKELQWFKLNDKKEFIECEKPEELNNICLFGE